MVVLVSVKKEVGIPPGFVLDRCNKEGGLPPGDVLEPVQKEGGLSPGDDLEPVQKPHEAPREMGKPVVIPKEDQEKMKEMFKINQFNLMASEMIALNRSLPDVRLEG